MKGSAMTKVIILVVIAIIGMVGFVFLKGSNNTPSTTAQSSSSNASAAISSAPIKDFAPGMPMSQKTTILIQTSDSSDIKYIVPTDQVDTYVKSLPPGYRVVSKNP